MLHTMPNSIGRCRADVCEVCGAIKQAGNWFLLAEDRRGNTLRILYWSDGMAQRNDLRACCSADHVERFVHRWLSSSKGSLLPGAYPTLDLSAQQEQQLRSALTGDLQMGRHELISGFAFQAETTQSFLDAVETLLEGYGADLEQDSSDPVKNNDCDA